MCADRAEVYRDNWRTRPSNTAADTATSSGCHPYGSHGPGRCSAEMLLLGHLLYQQGLVRDSFIPANWPKAIPTTTCSCWSAASARFYNGSRTCYWRGRQTRPHLPLSMMVDRIYRLTGDKR